MHVVDAQKFEKLTNILQKEDGIIRCHEDHIKTFEIHTYKFN